MSVNKIKHIPAFLIGTNIYIAFIATVISLTGFLLFNTLNFWNATGFVFFATQSAYNLQRYFKWRKNHLHAFLKPYVPQTKQTWHMLIGTSIAGMIACAFFLNFEQFILLGIISLPTALYVFVHPTKKKLTGLRYIPFLKTFLVAFCWTGMFFTLTYTHAHVATLKITWPYWLVVLLQVWQACILFDLRDLETDKAHIKTFANSLTRNGMFMFWLVFFTSIVFLTACYGHIQYVIPLYLVVAAVHTVCIYRKVGGLNFTFLVDGSLVVYAIANFVAFNHS